MYVLCQKLLQRVRDSVLWWASLIIQMTHLLCNETPFKLRIPFIVINSSFKLLY
jgi:hypothetical protein